MVKFTKNLLTDYQIGKGTYGKPGVVTWREGAILKIGAYCAIASGVYIFLGGNHHIDWVTIYPFQRFHPEMLKMGPASTSKGNVIIGNDVWIGHGTIILSGVTIGDGAVLGANTVIANDVLPYSVVIGNPGRVIKKRFSEENIEELLKIKWWSWSEEKIKDFLPLMLHTNIDKFIKAATK